MAGHDGHITRNACTLDAQTNIAVNQTYISLYPHNTAGITRIFPKLESNMPLATSRGLRLSGIGDTFLAIIKAANITTTHTSNSENARK